MRDTWSEYVADLNTQLSNLSVLDAQGEMLTDDEGFTQWLQLTLAVRANRGVV